ncbi:hypothetical protein AMATHDRAFT_63636 [Amanita thiersii Skay4041]|uniref:Uncharacterized protein n=1 Tax=Amanita thiersii Skay4041 TaxID=703135 RepID=A0A2A9NLK9_9AGAR|nr:hypothetical protein AMATHDRAFT_63636 [Amanita thiersii Skay4041]
MAVLGYHQFSANLSRAECIAAYRINGWMFCTGMALAEVILTIRIWIVWNKDRRLTYGLPIFFVIIWGAGFAVMGIFLNSLTFAETPHPLAIGCFVTRASRILSADPALLMFYNTGNLVLLVVRVSSFYWSQVDSWLIKRLYTDGVLYYLFLFAFCVINVAVIFSLPSEYINLLSSLQRVIHSILSGRVILDIRRHAAEKINMEPPMIAISPLEACP